MRQSFPIPDGESQANESGFQAVANDEMCILVITAVLTMYPGNNRSVGMDFIVAQWSGIGRPIRKGPINLKFNLSLFSVFHVVYGYFPSTVHMLSSYISSGVVDASFIMILAYIVAAIAAHPWLGKLLTDITDWRDQLYVCWLK